MQLDTARKWALVDSAQCGQLCINIIKQVLADFPANNAYLFIYFIVINELVALFDPWKDLRGCDEE